jgi:dipeptidase
LIAAGERELALDYLTYFSKTELLRSLEVAETLAQALEARTRALYGFKPDPMPRSAEQIW